ncbi:ATP-binding protein [Halarcobacter sp.]|uniref:AAA family ATPase n=1 Tax=Halarcobacter sp. TaxID=2321133 RepID=UPI002AA77F76|nr:ATP-binding protein [Halarcobacter sp.]
MLLQFSVNNHKSIKDTIEFSLLKESQDKGNSFKIRQYELLKSAIVYGANASGKSNFLKSLAFMGRIVLNKDKVIQSTDLLAHIPFRLNTETEDSSSTFEVVFFIDDIKYRYGFELDKTTVYSEWLYADEKGKEAKLFYRDIEEEDYVNSNRFKEGYNFFDKNNSNIRISKNQLFIWKCDQNDGEISKSILNWFNHVNFIDGIDHDGYIEYTMEQMENHEFKCEMINLIKTADIGIEDILLEKKEVPSNIVEELPFPKELKEKILKEGGLKEISLDTYHKKFDKNNNEIGNVVFNLEKEESIGTRKFFKMTAPILNTLKEGKILIIDELDASLHPMLTKSLIEMFHNEELNTKNAQLIFATHDTNLLTPSLFRRDQIWLTEKDKYGATNIYSLAQFKDVRAKENFEKNYIQGKYGAIPYLGKFEF